MSGTCAYSGDRLVPTSAVVTAAMAKQAILAAWSWSLSCSRFVVARYLPDPFSANEAAGLLQKPLRKAVLYLKCAGTA
jgi:hypothetical protein